MKKRFFPIILLSLLGALCLVLFIPKTYSTPTIKSIKGPVLIDRLDELQLNMKLIYSDLSLSQIKSYQVNESNIVPQSTAYSSFTQGFIESDKNALLLNAVNGYRLQEALEPISYYYAYHEIGNYGFLSLCEGLNTLYIINLSTYQVCRPTFDIDTALENQYIYHIVEGDKVYYLLTTPVNDYKAYLYTLDKEQFCITHVTKLAPPQKAVKKHHSTLDSNGIAYFVGNNSLLIITPEETIHLPLAFDPDAIYYIDGLIYTLSCSPLFLTYAVYNETIGLVYSGQVNLPNKFTTLVSSTIQDSILYTVTYDANHPLYRNYITLYDLESNSILYCLPLKAPSNELLALIDVSYDL